MARIDFGVGFKVDKSGLDQVKASLQEIQKLTFTDVLNFNKGQVDSPIKTLGDAKQALIEVREQADKVEDALMKAFNVKLNTVNVQTFNNTLKALNTDLGTVHRTFQQVGPTGENAFRSLANEITTTNIQLKQTHGFLNNIATTLTNTIKWNLASSAVNTLSRGVSDAWNFTKALDSSLNDIRIVTQKSSDDMANFARRANDAAKALGTTTTEYTNAALTFYQQGLGDEDVMERSRLSNIVANVTGLSGEDSAEYVTSVLNGYKVAAEDAEGALDKLAAVGAKTASSLEELATGMSKTAAAANSLGVSEDQLASYLSTIISVTRADPSQVGTALKTIFARISDIETGAEDAEVSLGEYTGAMAELGFSVLDSNNKLRDLGDVIGEIGGRWSSLSREQQISLAQTMAGTRQYSNLISLFDNWDKAMYALNVSMEANGILQQQQDIHMERTSTHLKDLTASLESLYMSAIDNDSINNVVDSLTKGVEGIDNFIQSIGGMGGILRTLGSVGMMVFSDQIGKSINTTIDNLLIARNNILQVQNVMNQIQEIKGLEGLDQYTQKLMGIKEAYYGLAQVMSPETFNQVQAALDKFVQSANEVGNLEASKNQLENFLKVLKQVTGQEFSLEGLSKDAEKVQLAIAAMNDSINEVESTSKKSFDTLGNDLSNIGNKISSGIIGNKLRIEVSQAVSEVNKFKTKLNDAANSNDLLKPKIELVTKALDEYNKKLQEIALARKNGLNKEDVQKLQEEAESAYRTAGAILEGSFNGVKDKAKELSDVINKELYGEASQSILRAYDQAVKMAEQDAAAAEQYLLSASRQELITNYTKITSSVVSLANALRTVSNLKNIWTNDDLSTGEKIFQTVTNLGMAFTQTVTAAISLQKAIKGVTAAQVTYDAASRKLAADMVTQRIATEGAEVATKNLNLTLLKSPWTWVITAIVAAGVALSAYIAKAENARKKQIEENNEIIESAKQHQEEAKAVDSAVAAYQNAYNTYKQTGEGKDALNDATKALAEQYGFEINQLDILAGKYDKINQKIAESIKIKGQEALVEAQGQLDAAKGTLNEKINVGSIENFLNIDDTWLSDSQKEYQEKLRSLFEEKGIGKYENGYLSFIKDDSADVILAIGEFLEALDQTAIKNDDVLRSLAESYNNQVEDIESIKEGQKAVIAAATQVATGIIMEEALGGDLSNITTPEQYDVLAKQIAEQAKESARTALSPEEFEAIANDFDWTGFAKSYLGGLSDQLKEVATESIAIDDIITLMFGDLGETIADAIEQGFINADVDEDRVKQYLLNRYGADNLILMQQKGVQFTSDTTFEELDRWLQIIQSDANNVTFDNLTEGIEALNTAVDELGKNHSLADMDEEAYASFEELLKNTDALSEDNKLIRYIQDSTDATYHFTSAWDQFIAAMSLGSVTATEFLSELHNALLYIPKSDEYINYIRERYAIEDRANRQLLENRRNYTRTIIGLEEQITEKIEEQKALESNDQSNLIDSLSSQLAGNGRKIANYQINNKIPLTDSYINQNVDSEAVAVINGLISRYGELTIAQNECEIATAEAAAAMISANDAVSEQEKHVASYAGTINQLENLENGLIAKQEELNASYMQQTSTVRELETIRASQQESLKAILATDEELIALQNKSAGDYLIGDLANDDDLYAIKGQIESLHDVVLTEIGRFGLQMEDSVLEQAYQEEEILANAINNFTDLTIDELNNLLIEYVKDSSIELDTLYQAAENIKTSAINDRIAALAPDNMISGDDIWEIYQQINENNRQAVNTSEQLINVRASLADTTEWLGDAEAELADKQEAAAQAGINYANALAQERGTARTLSEIINTLDEYGYSVEEIEALYKQGGIATIGDLPQEMQGTIINGVIETLQAQGQELQEALNEAQAEQLNFNSNSEQYQQLQTEIDGLNERIKETNALLEQTNIGLDNNGEHWDTLDDKIEKHYADLKDQYGEELTLTQEAMIRDKARLEASKEMWEEIKKSRDASYQSVVGEDGTLDDEIKAIRDSWAESGWEQKAANEQVKELVENTEELAEAASEASDQYESVADALADMNANFGFDYAIAGAEDMLDVGDDILNSMDNIIKASNMIGEGFLVAADDIGTLLEMFPELYDAIEAYTTDGVQLNEQMVNSVLQGQTQIINGQVVEGTNAIDVQIAKVEAAQAAAQAELDVWNSVYEALFQNAQTEAVSEADLRAKVAELMFGVSDNLTEAQENEVNTYLKNLKIQGDASADNAQVIGDNLDKAFAQGANSSNVNSNAVIRNLSAIGATAFSVGGTIGAALAGQQQGFFTQAAGAGGNIVGGGSYQSGIQGQSASSSGGISSQQILGRMSTLNNQIAQLTSTKNQLAALKAKLQAAQKSAQNAINNVGKGKDTVSKNKGGSGSSPKGKGSSSKDPEAEQIDLLDDEADIYHDINIEIARLNEQLEDLQRVEKTFTGKDLIDNLNKQLEIYEKQRDAIAEKIEIAKQEKDIYKSALEGYGATFDENGEISNYFTILQKQLDKTNDVIERYNNLSANKQTDAEKKKVEDAKAEYEDLLAFIEAYEELLNETIPDLEDEIEEMLLKEIEIQIEKFNMEVELRLDMRKAQEDWNKFKRKVIDDLNDDSLIGAAQEAFDNILSYYDTFNTGTGSMQAETDHIQQILEELAKMDAGSHSDIYSAYDDTLGKWIDDRASAMEDLKSAYDELADALKSVKDLEEEVMEAFLDSIDAVKDAYDAQSDNFEFVQDQIEHDLDLIEKMYGDDAYDMMAEYYEKQVDYAKQAAAAQQVQVDYWKQLMDAEQEAVANGYGSEEALAAYEENWKDAIKELNESIEKWADATIDAYKNTISAVIQELNNQITNGLGLDYINDEFKLITDNANSYLDAINSAYALQDLRNKWQDAINGTSDIAVQQQLNDLMNAQLAMLERKGELTQYDIDRAEKEYEIALKQIALQEAQQNKSKMRLRRDANGNYSYQFVSDEDQITQAQQELAAAQNELYNFDKSAYQDNLNEMYSVWKEFQDQIAKAYVDYADDQDALTERVNMLQEQYGERLNRLTEQNLNIRNNLYQSAFDELASLYDVDISNFENLTQEEKDLIMNDLIPAWDSGVQQMIDKFAGEGGFGPTVEETFDQLQNAADDYIDKMGEISDTNAQISQEAYDEMEQILDMNSQLIDAAQSEYEAIQDVLEQVLELTEAYRQAKEEALAATQAAFNYWQQENARAAQSAARENANISSSGGGSSSSSSTSKTTSSSTSSSSSSSTASTTSSSSSSSSTKSSASTTSVSGKLDGGQMHLRAQPTKNSTSLKILHDGESFTAIGLNSAGWLKLSSPKNAYMKYADYEQYYSSAFRKKVNQLPRYLKGGLVDFTGPAIVDGSKSQPESILNAGDTENLLAVMEIMRGITNIIDSRALSNMASMMSGISKFNTGFDTSNIIEQDVHIEATFPNVQSSHEIENAFNNLINVASQRAFRNGRGL